MPYTVKEIFYTLQGEGQRSGRPAVFCRFAGCNLWSGREQDRQSAICKFCDTDFVGIDGTFGGKFDERQSLVRQIDALWPKGRGFKYVVLTGGEPLLQVDSKLINSLHNAGFEVAVETNGTIQAPDGIDWLTVSPKSKQTWIQRTGNELKLIFPQKQLDPDDFASYDFEHYLIQPMDGPYRAENTLKAVDYCQANPRWKLSLQTHKTLSIR